MQLTTNQEKQTWKQMLLSHKGAKDEPRAKELDKGIRDFDLEILHLSEAKLMTISLQRSLLDQIRENKKNDRLVEKI